MIEVIDAGLMTTVQDCGRPGYFHLGIPVSGAMDRFALRAANLLVGNPEGEACLESVFIGPTLRCKVATVIAITGAEIRPRLNDTPMPLWESFAVQPDQVLSFDFLGAGARIYIAFAGGIQTPMQLGSRSTYVIGGLGGIDGSALKPGDLLPVPGERRAKVGQSVPLADRPVPASPCELRVLPGLFWRLLNEQSGEQFFSDDWKVAPEADRMGYRFSGGRAVEFVEREQPFGAGSDPSNIVDGPYCYGSIQVPGGSEPIVLHRDAVSGGGYFTLGAVISADMDLIGQLQPHAPVRFVRVDMDAALVARSERQRRLQKLRDTLG